MSHPQDIDSYLFGANGIFIEELYAQYQQNPSSVDPEWQQFFKSLGDNPDEVIRQVKGAPWNPRPSYSGVIGRISEEEREEQARKARANGHAAAAPGQASQATQDSVRALMLIRAYRVRGHLGANLDPLGIEGRDPHPELDPASYGFTDDDWDRPIYLGGVLGYESATLRDIYNILRQTYCSTMGVEFMHIQYGDQKQWIQERIEAAHGDFSLSVEEKKKILGQLIEVESFEQFLHVKYQGSKRFSIQGGDAMVPGLEAVIETAAGQGIDDIVFGMPHRGRMNVLTTIMKKPYVEMLSIFHGNLDFPHWVESSGDVKYHLGTSSDREVEESRNMHLSLTANPSHLEAVNPVVCGKVRAKQDQKHDNEKSRTMGVQLHGDAAFAGQGVVAETLYLSELKGYRTGGTIHIIVNNQIGFTTAPRFSRFTPYPSDVAKAVQAPVLHVNGEDPEAVVYACKLATEFRQQFKRDVVIDIFCYRKYGHNEGDEPMFTQPLMYKMIREKKLPAEVYADRLIREGVIDQDYVDEQYAKYKEFFEEEFEAARTYNPNKADWLEGEWAGYERPRGDHPQGDTGVSKKKLKEVGKALCAVPEGFHINSKLKRQLDAKQKMINDEKHLDWATGEALAFGTLLTEGFPVRLSGQDSTRGTFSQRHSGLVDQETEERYYPLNHIQDEQAKYEVIDSNLSEFAILGFEYGYSLTAPKALTLWEAQFGDFANGAQIIIDQFISSGENKWLRMCGLVMLLPHGYEGQGPEHSSARLERFLQLCAEDNMQVCNITTPANYFHVLRRQLHRKFRKPLIIMTPKSLLRHKMAVSGLDDFAPGTHFQPVIGETQNLEAQSKIKRVVICSGKVYYDLLEERSNRRIKDIAIIRLEQFYPFPGKLLKEELKKYKNADIVWCQEEPKNQGGWFFVNPRIENVLGGIKGMSAERPVYVGRPEAASPATGYLKIHTREQEELVDQALTL